jgi:heme acquisition protein HasR
VIRLSDGLGKYANGQKPSGSVFLAGRSEQWAWLVGAADSQNDAYRVGRRISTRALMEEAVIANNVTEHMTFNGKKIPYRENCRYRNVNGYGRFDNCQFTEDTARWLKEAVASGPLPGTQKQSESRMLRLSHYFGDAAHDQRLELFATTSHARHETDHQPAIYRSDTGDKAEWREPWSVHADLKNRLVSLKYGGVFSDWLNPEVQVYRENQTHKHNWTGTMGSGADGQPLHYFVEVGSTGLKLGNALRFEAPLAGPLRLDTNLELRRADKTVDSRTESDYMAEYFISKGNTNTGYATFDPDSRTDTAGLLLALSTENKGPWQVSVSVGAQQHDMDAWDTTFKSGNVKQGGAGLQLSGYWSKLLRTVPGKRSQAIPCDRVSTGNASLCSTIQSKKASIAEANKLAPELAAQESAKVYYDPTRSSSIDRFVDGKQEHQWLLKSASLALQYTPPRSGLSAYVQTSYNERAPTSNEMYMYGAIYKGYFNANPDLEPESNHSVQIGLNYQRKHWMAPGDGLDLGVNFYMNRIKNFIHYGSIVARDQWVDSTLQGQGAVTQGTSVNNLEPIIRKGVELNLNYQQSRFYVRGNLTLPIKHNNDMCHWQSPSGQAYWKSTNLTDASISYIPWGNKGEKICSSSWNWAEANRIEPIQGSLTAALTPMGGKLELGGTLHYRGRQRAAFWYDASRQAADLKTQQQYSKEGVPSGDKFIEAYLWPKVIKLDLFINYQLNEQFKAGIYLANITDQMDATTTTFAYNFYPGRTLTAHLEYRF